MYKMQRYSQNRNGFTLIEMVVALIITGALAAIAVPAYYQWVARSHVTEALAIEAQIKTNLEPQLRKLQKSGITICKSGSLGSPAQPVYSVIYNTLDKMYQPEGYFLIGTVADLSVPSHISVMCSDTVLWIDVLKSSSVNDPCSSGSNPKCQLKGCGQVLGDCVRSGVTVCRSNSGYYNFQGLGIFAGDV